MGAVEGAAEVGGAGGGMAGGAGGAGGADASGGGAVGAGGAGGGDAGAPGAAAEKRAIAMDMVAAFERLAASVHPHVDNCERMAAAIDAVALDSQAVFARARELGSQTDLEFQKWFDDTLGGRLKTAVTQFFADMVKNCGEHEGVKKAMLRMMDGTAAD